MKTTSKKDKIIEYLRKKGNKITPHRLEVLDILLSAKKPLSAEEIFQKLKNINLSTVYRILDWLKKEKVIKEIHLKEDFDRYELAERFSRHHHHFTCSKCGKIKDIDCSLIYGKKDLEKKNKIKIKSHIIEFFGVCEDCR